MLVHTQWYSDAPNSAFRNYFTRFRDNRRYRGSSLGQPHAMQRHTYYASALAPFFKRKTPPWLLSEYLLPAWNFYLFVCLLACLPYPVVLQVYSHLYPEITFGGLGRLDGMLEIKLVLTERKASTLSTQCASSLAPEPNHMKVTSAAYRPGPN